MQHVVAMFGATFLVPVLTGFPSPTTLFFSGVGTVLFLLVTRNQLPSYLGVRTGYMSRQSIGYLWAINALRSGSATPQIYLAPDATGL